LSEVGNRLNGDLAGLKAETDALRRQLEEGLAHRENRPASGTRLPTHQSRKSIDDDLRAKLAALNEQVEKLKSDLLALNAKVNVQQQMANRRDSVKVKSKAALGEDLVEGKDAVGEGASFDAGQIGNILIDMGTLRLCYEELKLVQAEMKKTEDKRAAKVDHLHEKLDALRHGMEHERDRVDREFKNIKIAIASLPGLPTTSTSTNSTNQNSNSTQNPVPTPTNSTPSPNANPNANGNGNSPSTPNPTSASNQSSASQRRDSENKSDHINDRISKLHQLMLESANQTDIERLREEFDEKIKEVTRALEKGLPPLQDGLAEVKARLDGL
jgi:Skp family chaperone for outer membrane proteins